MSTKKTAARAATKRQAASSGVPSRPPMPLEPLGDRVILRRLGAGPDKMYKNTLHLPEKYVTDKPTLCLVEAVGPGRYVEETGQRTPMTVKVGQTVLIGKFSGSEIVTTDANEQDHVWLIVRQDEILCGVNTSGIRRAASAPNY